MRPNERVEVPVHWMIGESDHVIVDTIGGYILGVGIVISGGQQSDVMPPAAAA